MGGSQSAPLPLHYDPNTVYLNVYRLTFAAGSYHTSVVVLGYEVSFAAELGIWLTDQPLTAAVAAGDTSAVSWASKFVESIPVASFRHGSSGRLDAFNEDALANILQKLSSTYSNSSYHLINLNCNHFCEDLIEELLRPCKQSFEFPAYITRITKLLPPVCHDIFYWPAKHSAARVMHRPRKPGGFGRASSSVIPEPTPGGSTCKMGAKLLCAGCVSQCCKDAQHSPASSTSASSSSVSSTRSQASSSSESLPPLPHKRSGWNHSRRAMHVNPLQQLPTRRGPQTTERFCLAPPPGQLSPALALAVHSGSDGIDVLNPQQSLLPSFLGPLQKRQPSYPVMRHPGTTAAAAPGWHWDNIPIHTPSTSWINPGSTSDITGTDAFDALSKPAEAISAVTQHFARPGDVAQKRHSLNHHNSGEYWLNPGRPSPPLQRKRSWQWTKGHLSDAVQVPSRVGSYGAGSDKHSRSPTCWLPPWDATKCHPSQPLHKRATSATWQQYYVPPSSYQPSAAAPLLSVMQAHSSQRPLSLEEHAHAKFILDCNLPSSQWSAGGAAASTKPFKSSPVPQALSVERPSCHNF